MDAKTRIERALSASLARAERAGSPPKLGAAMRHAVFPGGARVRPRLCLAVAAACGEDHPVITEAAAASIELLHCASLVHDDMPCFDDAATRRGRPSVHRAHGEMLALLAGDALIVLAFEVLGEACVRAPHRLAALLGIVAGSVGAPGGIVAGQAWECESAVDLAAYQRAKTGALFAAATRAGAAAAGVANEAWAEVGLKLGEAYQVADDIGDALSDAAAMGKPVGQDAAHGRPNAVLAMGVVGAAAHLESLAEAAVRAIPACRGASELRSLIALESHRLLPKDFSRSAA